MKSIQTQIDEILDHFDFERVHRCMHLMDWRWVTLGPTGRVPSVAQLALEAQRQLQWVHDQLTTTQHATVNTSSGGLAASGVKWFAEDGTVGTRVSLQFVVEEWESRSDE